MIRYVVAIVLMVALVAVAQGPIESAADANSERMIATGVSDLEDAAVSLASTEELPPPGHEGAQRFVTIDVPERSMTETPVDHFEIRRLDDRRRTVVTYRIEGRAMRTETIDVPIRNDTGGDLVDISGAEDRNLFLTLVRDEDDRPAVRVVRESEHYEP